MNDDGWVSSKLPEWGKENSSCIDKINQSIVMLALHADDICQIWNLGLVAFLLAKEEKKGSSNE